MFFVNHFKMKMGAFGISRLSHGAQLMPLGDNPSGFHMDSVQMSVQGGPSGRVFYDDSLPIT